MKTIGIKLADGSFFPVMEEGSAQTKNLELTTANNNQTCVMVDLYRSESGSMEDAEYIDTLRMDNLVEHPNGEPSLAFSLNLDENNQLKANITDPETGTQSDSSIPLISRTPEELQIPDDYTITESAVAFEDETPEEEIEEDPAPMFIASGSESSPLSFEGLYDKETERGTASYHEEENLPKKSKVSVWICISCAIICILATLVLLLFFPIKSGIKKSQENKNDNSVSIIEQVPFEEEGRPRAPEAKENEIVVIKETQIVEPAVTQKAPTSNVKYKLKWGDTLWDIANTYYKNPWKYKKIATFNNIKNPDHIISGTVIVIPEL